LIMQSVLYKNDNGSGDDTCPPCFNCMLTDYKCINSGQCSPANGRCTCTAGFGGDNCGKPRKFTVAYSIHSLQLI
jgi:hypothetical protein